MMLCWVLLGTVTATEPPYTPSNPPEWDHTGVLEAIRFDGVPRRYHALFPKPPKNDNDSEIKEGAKTLFNQQLASGVARHPVIVAFHGNGGDGASLAMQTPHLATLAPKQGYFLIYADGVQTPGSKLRCQERSWNSGTCCGAAYLNDVDDVGYVRDALDDLFKAFPSADRRRVFAIGTSNGGSMVVRVACGLPGLFAAVAPQIGSLESRDTEACANNCQPPEDGYEECEWDHTREGCSHRDWANVQPMIYSCEGLRRDPVDFLFFNGDLDPSTNVSGLIIRPTRVHKEDPEYYTTSFPPMKYAIDRLRDVSGCTPHLHNPELTFRNGTAGNRTRCHSYSQAGCSVNFTYCLSDAGHQWYGAEIDNDGVCRWQGYAADECDYQGSLKLYGPNTLSVRVSTQALDFFADVSKRRGLLPAPSLAPPPPAPTMQA